MPWADCGPGYLVKTFVLAPTGELQLEGETVCFDLSWALDIAESDCAWAAGTCVYAVGGRRNRNARLVAAFGLLSSSSDLGAATSAGEFRYTA